MDPIQEIEMMKLDIKEIRERQLSYVGKHHDMDKEILQVRSDLNYMRQSLDSVSAGINKILFTVAGGFVIALVGFIVKGGLTL